MSSLGIAKHAGVLVAALLAVAASSAEANLGQTRSQIEAQYGKPVQCLIRTPPAGTEMVCYHRPGFPRDSVEVTYLDGISQRERYTRFTSATLEKEDDESRITQKDIDVILKANSAGRNWNSVIVAGVKFWFLNAKDIHRAPASSVVQDDGKVTYFPMTVQTYAMGVHLGQIDEDAHTPKPSETLFAPK
jgi:hypothetical protein